MIKVFLLSFFYPKMERKKKKMLPNVTLTCLSNDERTFIRSENQKEEEDQEG